MLGRINWWEPKWAVPRLLGGLGTGVIGGAWMFYGRMTIYAAVESYGALALLETTLCETQSGECASKKNRRRVERNPV